MASVAAPRAGEGPRCGKDTLDDAEAVAIVTVVVAAAVPFGVTVVGEKEHVPPLGRPLQAKLTCWLKPPAGVTVMVVCAEPPALTEPLVGEAAILKLGGGAAATVTVTALDVEPEKLLSPP
jgi:hypothetical protein